MTLRTPSLLILDIICLQMYVEKSVNNITFLELRKYTQIMTSMTSEYNQAKHDEGVTNLTFIIHIIRKMLDKANMLQCGLVQHQTPGPCCWSSGCCGRVQR